MQRTSDRTSNTGQPFSLGIPKTKIRQYVQENHQTSSISSSNGQLYISGWVRSKLRDGHKYASFPPPITAIRAAAHKEQGHPLLPSCRGLQMTKSAMGLKLSRNIQAGSVHSIVTCNYQKHKYQSTSSTSFEECRKRLDCTHLMGFSSITAQKRTLILAQNNYTWKATFSQDMTADLSIGFISGI